MCFSNSAIRRRADSRSGACTMILLIIGSKWTLISAPSNTPESKRTPGPAGSTVRQTAIFDPVGLSGQAYWYVLYPVHRLIFRGMLRRIAAQAT